MSMNRKNRSRDPGNFVNIERCFWIRELI